MTRLGDRIALVVASAACAGLWANSAAYLWHIASWGIRNDGNFMYVGGWGFVALYHTELAFLCLAGLLPAWLYARRKGAAGLPRGLVIAIGVGFALFPAAIFLESYLSAHFRGGA